MPVFELFEGLIISVYSRDHLPPHCHVNYAEFEALIDIRNFDVIAGRLPAKKLKAAISFIGQPENQADLLEMFYQLNPQIKRQ